MKKQKLLTMTECAIMIALATVLNMFPIYKMPMGGSVTLMSMLPIVMISIKRGLKAGLSSSFLFSLINLYLGLGDLKGLSAATVAGSVALDFILPFTALGLTGVFRKKGFGHWIAGISGVVTLRFIFHFASGVILWSEFAEDMNPVLYSLLYNGTYMLPELIITVAGAVMLLKVPQVNKLFTPSTEA